MSHVLEDEVGFNKKFIAFSASAIVTTCDCSANTDATQTRPSTVSQFVPASVADSRPRS